MSKPIECFIHAQKSTGLKEARQRIFQRYLTFNLGERPSKIVYVIPQNKHRDHASEGAQVLAELLGVHAYALKIEPRSKYKMKGRRERGQTQGIIDHCVSVKGERVWFYDDVITTGTTVKAVWNALGKPQAFQAVALVYRARLGDATNK